MTLDTASLACRTLPPGVEYILHDSQEPHLFVIHKRKRESPKNTTSLAFYYILDGKVSQAPALHTTILSRMVGPMVDSNPKRDVAQGFMGSQSCCLWAWLRTEYDLPFTLQTRCLFNVRAAFNRIQTDIDPLQPVNIGLFPSVERRHVPVNCRSQIAHWSPSAFSTLLEMQINLISGRIP